MVTEPVIPSFEIFNCSGNAARVIPSGGNYDFFRIYYLNDSITTEPEQLSEVIQFPNSNQQTIRIRGFLNDAPDKCSDVSFNFIPINNITPPLINELEIQQHCLNLAAATLKLSLNSLVRHVIQYSTDNINFVSIDTVANVNSYNVDNLPIASRQICFKIIAIDECSGAQINSTTICDDKLNLVIPVVNDISASFVNNRILFNWEDITIIPANYDFSKIDGNITTVNEIEENTFTDNQVRGGNKIFQYTIVSKDTCGNNSVASDFIIPVFLNTRQVQNNNYEFNWNDYQGWNISSNDVSYELEILDDDNQFINSVPIENNTFERNIVSDKGTRYRIRANDIINSRSVLSNIEILKKKKEILIPTAFTPNKDGLNDIFLPIINEAESFEMKILNRWGEIIFFSESILIGWDGIYKTGTAPGGTYIYQISLKKVGESVINQNGTFILIR